MVFNPRANPDVVRTQPAIGIVLCWPGARLAVARPADVVTSDETVGIVNFVSTSGQVCCVTSLPFRDVVPSVREDHVRWNGELGSVPPVVR